ncbi:carbamoyltransferase C-terminal domain-containing protein [Actinoplanes sp. NEAU-A12]|uniref:Carbamoyltransferase C-terminal domain-containing protein n=1 Tax=Actinoplanes sandaracinus TaxID=3045177 RepID=A0ABT6WUC8_9ACTN|nr:carbamoyltransferase C-terminal domain-containing protein [Actinoplanes sandaracinus]MDI6103342.1 carbamoyltransferase C-terminal domain-containing protein [Actinoplanes sandaracinus]
MGIACSHNSAVALVRDGRVVVAVQTERLVRIKRHPFRMSRMPVEAARAIAYCLRYAGIDLPDLAKIAVCTPWAVSEPRFDVGGALAGRLPPFVTVAHHLAHAEYALHYSPMEPGLVVVCDGSGTFERDRSLLDIRDRTEGATIHRRGAAKESISGYAFDGANLRLVHRIAYGRAPGGPHLAGVEDEDRAGLLESMGHLWRWAAHYCHGSVHEAGKVMGLSPFGDPQVHSDLRTLRLGRAGRMLLDFRGLLDRCRTPNLESRDVTGERHYADVAAHVQAVTDDFLTDLFRFLLDRVPARHVSYAGGVALNGIANETVRRRLGVDLHLAGSCEDNGTAIGAALAAHHAETGVRVPEPPTDYHGREYGPAEIAAAVGSGRRTMRLADAELLDYTAGMLAAGRVVGWFQGRGEFGPRALGNRSILADARDAGMQDRLNHRVKHREAFRPYAPAVLEEHAGKYFDLAGPSPMMLRVVPVTTDALPAVTHVDGSARVQTVARSQNPRFYDLIAAFQARTGVPVLLNTSFNRAGEPIVETPHDALDTFDRTEMDLLVLGNTVVTRNRDAT